MLPFSAFSGGLRVFTNTAGNFFLVSLGFFPFGSSSVDRGEIILHLQFAEWRIFFQYPTQREKHMESIEEFRRQYTHEVRYRAAETILERHPDRLPVIVEERRQKGTGSAFSTTAMKRTHKFLAPSRFTMGDFKWILRQRLQLDASQSLIVATNHESKPPAILPAAQLLKEVYPVFKDSDQWLYFQYFAESSFGYPK